MGEEERPPVWAEKLLEASKAHGDNLEELTSSVGDLRGQTEVNFAKLGTRLDGLEDRAKEDRDRADKKEVEIEGKIGNAHQNNQVTDRALGEVRGELKNHMDDEHATRSAHTAEKLSTHLDDNNRHGGEAPGKNGTAKTAGIAGGVGFLVVLAELARQWLTGS